MFAGDGQLLAPWGSALEAAGLPPTMVVGAHRAADETRRLHEYVAGESSEAITFDPARFEKPIRAVSQQGARLKFDSPQQAVPPVRSAQRMQKRKRQNQ